MPFLFALLLKTTEVLHREKRFLLNETSGHQGNKEQLCFKQKSCWNTSHNKINYSLGSWPTLENFLNIIFSGLVFRTKTKIFL